MNNCECCSLAHVLIKFTEGLNSLTSVWWQSFYLVMSVFGIHRGDRNYKPNPRLARVLDILFILHAEHEMNCSTAATRHLASRYINILYSVSLSQFSHAPQFALHLHDALLISNCVWLNRDHR